MASVKKKQIKPLVSILPLEPKDVERFWPLAEFMVAEALAFLVSMQILLGFLMN